jgi:5-methylcytosine-specific restriction endonuclease McrA
MSSKQFNVTVSKTKEICLASAEMMGFKDDVGLDLSFQSEARWPDSQKSEFITSLLHGMAPSKIVIADIDACMESLSKHSRDYKYFEDWKLKGKKYISIDGNNRTITIDQYLKGKVTIAHGEYLLPSGKVDITSKNDRYTTHPQELRDHISQFINISVCYYTMATRSDLSDLFRSINNGVPLNAQELRNATLVDFASDIRDLVAQYSGAFKHIKKDNVRRAIDEQFVNLAVYHALGPNKGIKKNHKDEAYEENSSISKAFDRDGRKVIEETMKMVEKYADAGFKEVSTLMNFFIAVNHLHKENRKITDKEKFFKWFMATENARIGDKTYLAETKEGESRSYLGCNKSTSADFLIARYDYIVSDLQSVPLDIVHTPDPERLFTQQQRYEMWVQQKGVCPRTGKKIPESEINNHDLWHADHVIPYSEGGSTTLENGELVCKDYNLKKSNKMPELMVA